jgi:glutamyl-tRNA synthetase
MSKTKLVLDPVASPPPYAAAIAAVLVASADKFTVECKTGGTSSAILEAAPVVQGSIEVAKAIGALTPELLPIGDDVWIIFGEKRAGGMDFSSLMKAAAELDTHLRLNTFLNGNAISVGDILCWSALRCIPAWNKSVKEGAKAIGPEVTRWFNHISTLDATVEALRLIQENASRLKEKQKDQASYDIDLIGAEQGKVVTRFPPEPSGYLHIGHAKAAMLNQYFAQAYGGKLIIRFDDTNPSKEKSEYEESILEDLQMLGIKGDVITYSSDYFDDLTEYCRRMIREGKAYADDTPKEQMQDERFKGIASKNRDLLAEESLGYFEAMLRGDEAGQTFCIRAKLSVDNPNKAMRDPVIFRCNLTPHHRTGSRYKAYPTYDFACPIIDSVEGVTHALRTNEYHDRNDQYYWMIDALDLRKPFIWDYSRMNFVYTLLSKRKLNWFVNNNIVTGWDDPRFPTVRGVLRRGLTAAALREYILMQGPSKNTLLLEWDKLWAVNKKHIDPIAPRFVALANRDIVRINLSGGPVEPYTTEMAKHKKNPELGNKMTAYSSHIFLEQEDVQSLEIGEEFTLMDWGNAIVQSIQKEDGQVISIEAKLHLEGDFKKTKKKLTWLSPDPNPLVAVILLDYDYLITKKKLDENDAFEQFVTPISEFVTHAIGDANLVSVQKGEIVQLERKGFFICDQMWSEKQPIKLIAIPDGKVKSISSKNDTSKQ